jgi:hypothetical protein
MDYLSIVAILKRSGGSRLTLHDAKVRVSRAQGVAPEELWKLPQAEALTACPGETKLISIERLSFATTSGKVLNIRFEAPEPAPLLNIAPADEMQFATLYEIPADQPYIVEVAIFGKRWGKGRRSQWRASAISLPNILNKP